MPRVHPATKISASPWFVEMAWPDDLRILNLSLRVAPHARQKQPDIVRPYGARGPNARVAGSGTAPFYYMDLYLVESRSRDVS